MRRQNRTKPDDPVTKRNEQLGYARQIFAHKTRYDASLVRWAQSVMPSGEQTQLTLLLPEEGGSQR